MLLAAFTDKVPTLVLPEPGVTVSQVPPKVVDGVAIKLTFPLDTVKVRICAAGAGPFWLWLKVSEMGATLTETLESTISVIANVTAFETPAGRPLGDVIVTLPW